MAVVRPRHGLDYNGWFADWYDLDQRRHVKKFATQAEAEIFLARQELEFAQQRLHRVCSGMFIFSERQRPTTQHYKKTRRKAVAKTGDNNPMRAGNVTHCAQH